MRCYRDMSYCANQIECANTACQDRISDHEMRKAFNLGVPISWVSQKDTCGNYAAKQGTDAAATTQKTLSGIDGDAGR